MLLRDFTDFLRDLPLRRFLGLGAEHRVDWVGPAAMLVLAVYSVFFIYSAQSYTAGNAWKMQFLWFGLGAIAYWLVSMINYKAYMENAHLIYWVAVVFLLPLVAQSLIYGAGGNFKIPLVHTRFGATRWLDFGPLSLQPSELAKMGTLIMVTSILARSEIGSVKDSIKVLIKVAVAAFIPLFLIFLQPDLGSALVIPPMVFSLLYVSNLSKRFFVTVFCLFMLAVGIVGFDVYRYQDFLTKNDLTPTSQLGVFEDHSLVPLRDYQRNRILAFVAPSVVDPKGTDIAWNLNQSLYAVGGGGVLGKGLGEGTQARLGYLPPTVATNDFIFAVVAEESGFLGSLVMLGAFFVLIVNGIRVAGLARDRFGSLLAVGVSVIFTVHVFINVGMTIGLMPITGVPLPFISYGGSFVLVCCVLQGFVQSVYRFRKDFS